MTGPLKSGFQFGTSELLGSPVPEVLEPVSGVKGNPPATRRLPLLPAADQLVLGPSGAASEALPVSKRQQIAGVRVELVVEAVGCDPAVQLPPVIGTGDIRWLVTSRRSEDSGIQIHRFPPAVIRLKSESAVDALR